MLTPFQSKQFRFWSFVSMVCLVYVHGYNLNNSYLQPWTTPQEPLTITTFVQYWLANGLLRFRIPMLFIISGYLFALSDNQPYKQRTRKRVRTLLYPYLIWSAVGLLFTFVVAWFPAGRAVLTESGMAQLDEQRVFLQQYHWYEWIARWLFFPIAYQLWFIRVLFIYNLAYPVIRWCVTHRIARRIWFPVVIILWLGTQNFVLIEGEGLFFFSLGIWLQKKDFDIDHPSPKLNPVFWGIVLLVLSVAKTLVAFLPHFDAQRPILIFTHKAVVFSGLITAWYGGKSLVRYCMARPWFAYLTAFSFMIYVLHAPLVVYANTWVFMYLGAWQYRLATFILLPFALILLSTGIGYLFRKVLPGLYRFTTGGRGL
jgi:fucose 4-O-acetylase-like acetyltransferase